MATEVQGAIDALLVEDRRYEPEPAFQTQANWNDPAIYERAQKDPEGFWAEQAKGIDWISRTKRCSTGPCRTRTLSLRGPSGSSAASSTCRTTASIAM